MSSAPLSPCPALIRIVTRLAILTLVVFGAMLGIWVLSRHGGTRLFSEGSILEWLQFGALVLSSLLAVLGARLVSERRAVFVILAVLPALGALREQDKELDRLIPTGGWQLPFFLLLTGLAIFVWRQRACLCEQLLTFIRHRAFGMMWGALMIGIPFGQMIGHGTFLSQLFGDEYQRPFKRVIEESAESLAYLMILLATIDWLLDSLSARRALPPKT